MKHCQLEFEFELYLLIVKTTKDKKFTRAEEALQKTGMRENADCLGLSVGLNCGRSGAWFNKLKLFN